MKFRMDFLRAFSITDRSIWLQSRSGDVEGSRGQGHPKLISPSSGKKHVTRIAQSAVMSALVAVLTIASIPMPPPLSTVTLAPVAIFVASIFLGPEVGFVSGLLGSAIGFTIAATVGIVGGAAPGSALFPIFLVGIIVARGPEGFVIGTLRRRSEILAMVLGTIYETAVFFTIDFFYTYPILLGMSSSFAFLDFGTLIDLIFILPAVGVLRYLRAQLGVRYYDDTRSTS